jgi:hypothetical protein
VDRRDPTGLHDPRLAGDLSSPPRPAQHDGLGRRRQHPPLDAEKAGGLLDTLCKVPGRRSERRDEQVAEGVSLELAGAEAVLEGLGEERPVGKERTEAAAEITRGRDAELGTESAGRATVVGDRDDGGDLAGVSAGRPQRLGGTVATPEGYDLRPFRSPAHRSMSRW